jgi:fused signal recognition particle receptor
MGFFNKIKSKVKKQQDDVVLDAIQESKKDNVDKYSKAMKKSRDSFTKKIKILATRHKEIDEGYFDELEETLITSDLGATYVMRLVEKLKTEVRVSGVKKPEEMTEVIFEKMFSDYVGKEKDVTELKLKDGELNVILVIGVNGVGKTTSIGKLTKRFQDEGKTVALAAADTFRAGAVEQLRI